MNHPKKVISAEKLAANRKNAQRSTGPKTSAGKQRSSVNHYKHGFYASRLFPTQELIDRDWKEYKRIFDGYWRYYEPVGEMEMSCVEEIAVMGLRLARLLGYEQTVLGWRAPFEAPSMDRIGRYEWRITRQREKIIAELERLQEIRNAQSDEFEASDLAADDVTEETSKAPENLTTPQQPPDITTSTTAPQCVEVEVARTDGEPSNKPAETVASDPPPTENGTTNAGVTKPIEPAVEQEQIGSSRWIETAEDEKFVQRLLHDLYSWGDADEDL